MRRKAATSRQVQRHSAGISGRVVSFAIGHLIEIGAQLEGRSARASARLRRCLHSADGAMLSQQQEKRIDLGHGAILRDCLVQFAPGEVALAALEPSPHPLDGALRPLHFGGRVQLEAGSLRVRDEVGLKLDGLLHGLQVEQRFPRPRPVLRGMKKSRDPHDLAGQLVAPGAKHRSQRFRNSPALSPSNHEASGAMNAGEHSWPSGIRRCPCYAISQEDWTRPASARNGSRGMASLRQYTWTSCSTLSTMRKYGQVMKAHGAWRKSRPSTNETSPIRSAPSTKG